MTWLRWFIIWQWKLMMNMNMNNEHQEIECKNHRKKQKNRRNQQQGYCEYEKTKIQIKRQNDWMENENEKNANNIFDRIHSPIKQHDDSFSNQWMKRTNKLKNEAMKNNEYKWWFSFYWGFKVKNIWPKIVLVSVYIHITL